MFERQWKHWMMLGCGVAVAIATLATANAAAADSAFTYQGRLTFQGQPVTEPTTMSFRLFDALTDGTQIGPVNTLMEVGFQPGGLFTVTLDFGEEAFDGNERWLEIAIGATVLEPRQPIRATPYAMRTLNGEDIWSLNGDVAYYADGRVGIGTDTPGAPLEVRSEHGRTRLGNDIGNIRTRLTFIDDDDNDTFLEKLDGGRLRFRVGGTNTRMTITASGNVGIATQNPSERLHVNGNVLVNNDVTANGDIDAGGSISGDTVTARQNLGPGNAPEAGTVYGDNMIYAWAHVRGDGVIMSSYGISHVNKFGTGFYDVHYSRSYDNPLIAMVTGRSSNDFIFTTANAGTNFATVRTQVPGNIGGQFVIQPGDRDFYIVLTGRAEN